MSNIFERYNTTVSTESASPVEVDPIKQLYVAIESISNEAAELTGVAGWFVNKGANLSIAISNGFRLLTTFKWKPLASLNPSRMEMILRTKDFLTVADEIVPMPRGFTGNLGDYITNMAPRVQLAATLKTNVIDKATSYLGHYLTLTKERADRRGFPQGAAPIGEIGQLLAEEGKWFTGGQDATAPFGELYHSFSDFIKAERTMGDYAKVMQHASPEDVKKAAMQLSQVAEALFQSLAADNDPVSKELMVTIGHQIEAVAKWIEWYALQISHLTEVNHCLEITETQLR
jgi:hypothetical protein